LFTEKELTEEERQMAEKLPAMRKEKGKPILFYNGMTPEGIAMLIEDIKKLKQ